ncbi:MAG: hypothetical protein K6B75_04245, partial [Lachnospiraceae bacterium]|nr:hypothetical protein [Lachnospiraceae bacterium]
IVLIIFLVGISKINKKRTEVTGNPVSAALEEIDITGKNDVLVAESDTKKLYVNPVSMNVIVEDKESGVKYSAIQPDGKKDIASLINLTYLGEDKAFVTWDSFTYVTSNQSYVINKIEDGVAIKMNFNEGASARFYEYMPSKMTYETYEIVFEGGIEKALEEERITKKEASKYKQTLSLVYSKNKKEECYFCNYVAAPPLSAVKQLIALTGIVGFTQEDLIKEAAEFGLTVEFTDPPVFDITVEFTLENNELVVRIPAESIIIGNENYVVQNIEVLPSFAMTTGTEVEEGYLLIPDGSGALMKMNTYDAKIPDYVRPVYDNDYYTDYFYIPEYKTELMMPVFGLLSLKNSDKTYGVMGVIESGADRAYIEAMLASSDASSVGRPYNKVYSSFDIVQYENVHVFGEYAENGATYLVKDPQTTVDCTIRYYFYTDEASYFKMAEDYRDYLIATSNGRWNKENLTYQDSAELYLEFIGALSLEERFLGIPYNTEISLTSYTELFEILEDLKDKNLTVSYLGVFDGGLNNKLMRTGKTVSENGSKKELDHLLEYVKSKDIDFYMGTQFRNIYSSGNGYHTNMHGLQGYSRTAVDLYGYDVAMGVLTASSNNYSLLSPKYLVDTVKDFEKATKRDYNYFLADLTNMYYADYGNDYISPEEAQKLVDMAIESFDENALLALDDPRADKLKYGNIAVNVARESSDYNSFYCTIPFRQLVLNGLMKCTTETVNNTSKTARYYLLQAVELGTIPKFMLSYESVDLLKNTNYAYLYSMQYSVLEDKIKEIYYEYEQAMKKIGLAKITDH